MAEGAFRERSPSLLRQFRWTLAALGAASSAAWHFRAALTAWFFSPRFMPWLPDGAVSPLTLATQYDAVTELAVVVAVLPIFAAEAWLRLCERTHLSRRRKLAVSFALASAFAILTAVELARHASYPLVYHLGSLSARLSAHNP